MIIEHHYDNAVTPHGLRHALRTMRWADLEELAINLEIRRRGESERSKRALTADMIADYATYGDAAE